MVDRGPGQPGAHRRHAGLVDQHLALLVALAGHGDDAPVEVEVVDVEAAQLGDPHAAPVEELEHGVVTEVAGRHVRAVRVGSGVVGVAGPRPDRRPRSRSRSD